MTNKLVQSHSSRAPINPLRATLHDVAALAGVSIKTVSRVVNHQGAIKEATRQQVQAAIDQLGYRPNGLARGLVRRYTNTLAVVAWGLEHYGPSRTVVGIEEQAHQLGYSLVLSLSDQPDEYDREYVLDPLLSQRVEGIVWAAPEVGNNHAWLNRDELRRLPPIVFLSMQTRSGATVVAIDNEAGGRRAVQHLLELGRRRIGIITGPLAWWETRERYLGWKNALEQIGLMPGSSLVVESMWSAAAGAQAMRQLLLQSPDLDALFASSDQIALGALGVIHKSGRRVPEDVAVVGFDNIPESAFFWPPLTTVCQQLTDVGHIAVQKLHQMIEERREGSPHVEASPTYLEPDLIIRASTVQT